ncbi:Sugar transferase involved in LPS biosynthesis (colanic, teichoic acid) [Algoriphagus locisalis]|uniref:Sugar transferase involved in LPS biosynthesis (Colanic, teichoic acid) n=1 Tax=Algoriphagus locisalis TaxID=305507 RepID=A0A1I7AFS7_9BACT|nr:sugar transferase [Algoriphagus locisalis]SFT73758.1 Sugar transferase involved in LPS biosynthesis (colanic, teichoic acid) [Algoriphagus locisalis]
MIPNSTHQQEIVFKGYQSGRIIPDLYSLTNISRSTVSQRVNEGIEVTTRFAKRTFDILFSSLAILTGLPVFLTLMAITKLTSKGPVFYKQERIGRNGQPFYILKFRSMIVDSELNGPQLTSDNDPRITKWGNFMRKTHLDELPQFFNVLMGDMSVVGPRPERAHFIQQIVARQPLYTQLLTIRPGITSIGQVDYGYAETVEEMCQRMILDLKYLSQVNLLTDLKVIGQTVMTMINKKGK